MNNLVNLLILCISGIFQIVATCIQFAFIGLVAALAAPFAFVFFIYILFVENKKD